MRIFTVFPVVLALFKSGVVCTEDIGDLQERSYVDKLPIDAINEADSTILDATKKKYQKYIFPKNKSNQKLSQPPRYALNHREAKPKSHPEPYPRPYMKEPRFTRYTNAPEIYGPSTHAPKTYAPKTYGPSTYAPKTYGPSTHAPETYAPKTYGPSTHAPETYAPKTYGPSTHAPETYAPKTYGPSTYAPKTYGPSTHAPETYAPPPSYHSPSAAYRPYAKQPPREEYTEYDGASFPFIGDEPEDYQLMPMLGTDSHCFLQSEPFCQCGPKSLQSLMMEQCLSFFVQMTRNIEGLCCVKDNPKDRSEVNHQSNLFLKERCYHRAFVSITAAMVMCMTENIVRTAYIQHYAIHAATNPIEGPVLYLRKLHEFIESVLRSTGGSAQNKYPTLWREFKTPGLGQYNPHSPFKVDNYGEANLQHGMSQEAAGLKNVIVGSKFLCSETSTINSDGFYRNISSEPHYQLNTLNLCSAQSKELLGYRTHHSGKKISKAAYECNDIIHPRSSQPRYHSDMTLRGLYESVRYTNKNSRRPLTIAEIATKNSNFFSQPLLEGYGIMYFCAFHACKANTGNNLNGACFPELESSLDWELPEQGASLPEYHQLSLHVEICKRDGWLDASIIEDDAWTKKYLAALKRSYICMAESEIVRFAKIMNPNVEDIQKEDAFSLVYLRHIVIEKCYETEEEFCIPTRDLYFLLNESLTSLLNTCHQNHRAAMKDVRYFEK